MQRFSRVFVVALTIAAAGCVDEGPVAPVEPSGAAPANRPFHMPRLSFSAMPSAAPGGITPYFTGFGSLGILMDADETFVVGGLIPVYEQPMVPFLATVAHAGAVYATYPGLWTAYNGRVAAGFQATTASVGPFGPGQPVIEVFDYNGTDLPTSVQTILLPLPEGAFAGEVNAIGNGIRPVAVGSAYMEGGSIRAVLWVFHRGLNTYEVSVLPGTAPGSDSKANDLNRDWIVGERNGHPAYWTLANPAVSDELAFNGSFVAINASGRAVGSGGASVGFLGAVNGPFIPLAITPTDINDLGYISGHQAVGTGVLRLRTGALRDVPTGYDGTELGAVPFFITNEGVMGGVVFMETLFVPQLWRFETGPDTDGDLVPDGLDNCPTFVNRDQADADSDHVGDVCTPPVASFTPSHLTRREGSFITFDATASSDPFGRRLTYSWDFDDGSTGAILQRERHTFVNDGVFNVTLTADNGRATDTESVAVTVTNVAPEVTDVTPATLTPTVGAILGLTFNVSDAGAADVLEWRVVWGDGSRASRGICSSNPCSVNVDHTYAAAGVFQIRVTATDDDGGTTIARAAAVTASE